MDNSEFLSYFWDLQDNVAKEKTVEAAESIVRLVEAKQKFERDNTKPIDSIKYKLYLNIAENPSEDLLYTLRRLVNYFITIDRWYTINRCRVPKRLPFGPKFTFRKIQQFNKFKGALGHNPQGDGYH
jgi:hypothetical protein